MRRSPLVRSFPMAVAIIVLALAASSCTDTLLLANIKATNDVATYGTIPSPTVTPPAAPWGTQVFTVSEAATTGTGAGVTSPSFTYTTDGTTPTRASTVVSGSTISLASSAADLKVLAFVPDWPESADAVTDYGAVKVFDLRMIVQKASTFAPRFWDNGTATDIGTATSAVYGWVLLNGVYYIAGDDGTGPNTHVGYWTSNDLQYHQIVSSGQVKAIAVDASGVLYLGGADASGHPTYWTVVAGSLVGTRNVDSSAETGSVSCILVSGTTLYLGGGLSGGHNIYPAMPVTYDIPTIWVDDVSSAGVPSGPKTPIPLTANNLTMPGVQVTGESVLAMGVSNGEILAYGTEYSGASAIGAVWSVKSSSTYTIYGTSGLASLAGHSGWAGMMPNGGAYLGSRLYVFGIGNGPVNAVVLPITQNTGAAPTTDDAAIMDLLASSSTAAFCMTAAGGDLFVGGYNGYTSKASIWINDSSHQYDITVPAGIVGVMKIDVVVK